MNILDIVIFMQGVKLYTVLLHIIGNHLAKDMVPCLNVCSGIASIFSKCLT